MLLSCLVYDESMSLQSEYWFDVELMMREFLSASMVDY